MFHGLLAFVALVASAVAGPALQPSPIDDESYAETYTAVASLEDGSFVLMQFLFTNAGFGDRKGACRALWVPPGKTGINASANASKSEWAYDGSKRTLTVGPCHLGAFGDGLRFVANLDGLSITLQMKGKARTIRPPDNRINVGDGFYESDIVVARADAKATIRAGGKTLIKSGAVHLDHSRSNTLLPKVASCWMRFRGFSGAEPTLLQVRLPAGSAAPKAWSWPLSTAAPAAVPSSAVKVGKASGGMPQFTVGAYAVKPTRTVYRYRPTEAYGALGKLAAPWIGDPTTTTYRASATGPAGVQITGILEVSEIVENGCRAQ